MAAAPQEEEDVVARLVEAFQNGGPAERLAAARDLAELGPAAEGAVPALVAALRQRDLGLRTAAALALSCIGRPAVTPLVAALQDEDVDFRQAVITTLGLIGRAAKPAVPVLKATLADEQLAPAAEKALRQIQRSPFAALFAHVESLMPGGLAAAALLGAAALASVGFSWAAAEFFPASGGAAGAAALAVGLLGAALGAVGGGHRWGGLGAAGGALVLGLGGGLTGLMLGGLFGSVLEPINRALGRR